MKLLNYIYLYKEFIFIILKIFINYNYNPLILNIIQKYSIYLNILLWILNNSYSLKYIVSNSVTYFQIPFDLIIKNTINNNSIYNFNEHLINIRIVSKVKKGGIIRRFIVTSAIGSQTGWLGLGRSKKVSLYEASESSLFNSFKNIYFININLIGDIYFKNKYKKYKNTKIVINNNKYDIKTYSNNIRIMEKLLGNLNISVKILNKTKVSILKTVLLLLNNII